MELLQKFSVIGLRATRLWGPNDISGMAEARVVKFYTQVDYIMS